LCEYTNKTTHVTRRYFTHYRKKAGTYATTLKRRKIKVIICNKPTGEKKEKYIFAIEKSYSKQWI